ncbi:uncharacterized protein [Macrobrachium rosenbergii]|uniref:uncharacterized protein n=1 Tax=Macrobrachium rosenbergii TaxID=79674 RepID=UPI0034D5278A
MEGDLQSHRDGCASCDVHAPSQPAEPSVLTPPPEYPFQSTVVDMLQLEGHMYMAYADRLTRWLEVAHFPHSTSSRIISVLRTYFTRWGAPGLILIDGGTNLISEETTSFFRKWGLRLSSPVISSSQDCQEDQPRQRRQPQLQQGIPGNSSVP